MLPTVGLIKPTDKIPLGSFMEDIEEMHKKTIDPVTGRLFLKHSLQDELTLKLKREQERFEERFGHIETNKEYQKVKEESDAQTRLIREMSIDNDKILPDERTRHWMMAQSHIHIRDGAEDEMNREARINQGVNPEGERTTY